ncbi:MAG: SAM-dependent chlorinase/fluorinase [Nitrospinae bacterium]|nr:SAM-dependent chlorinase/fluorinase [Nitrospinota bacterium]
MVTLTTDFGTSDPWVGIMKGVMLSTNPALTIAVTVPAGGNKDAKSK